MFTKLAPVIEKVRASFWLVPSLMIFVSFVLALITIYWDATQNPDALHSTQLLYSADVEAIRSLLSTIAASMVTVTSIAFSITIVALTLASSQFGPRLLRNFMMDTGTQFVLGSFISTFLFCIIVFCAISFEAPFVFKPGITVLVAITMTCASVCILIYFIHHVAKSIQADVVINDVYCDLKNSIEKLFPDNSADFNVLESSLDDFQNRNIYSNTSEVLASSSGYLQLIDKSKLLDLAHDLNCMIQIHCSPGDFVVQKSSVATVYSYGAIDKDINQDVNRHLMLGARRTPVQDPEFAINQLVEIALRALSPSINDPFTAISCIDKLNAILCNLTHKKFPQPYSLKDGQLKLVCKELAFTDVAAAAFNQIREQAEGNIAVTMKLVESLQVLFDLSTTIEQRQFVQDQIMMIKQQQDKQSMSDYDKKCLMTRIEAFNNKSQASN